MLLEAPPQSDLLGRLSGTFPAGSIQPQEGYDQPTWIVDRAVLPALARELHDNPATKFDLLLDICGVDYPDREQRFEAVYHLYRWPAPSACGSRSWSARAIR